jgi:DNA-damage-inducible protein J
MATVPVQIRIDENLKKQATELFSQLGIDMSSAMNIFLRQCVMRRGLPFDVVIPQYKPEVTEALEDLD